MLLKKPPPAPRTHNWKRAAFGPRRYGVRPGPFMRKTGNEGKERGLIPIMTGVSQTGPRPRPRGRREGKKLLLRPAPPVVPRSGRRSHVRRRSVSAERLVIANHMLKIPQPLPDVKAKCKNFLRFLKIPRKPLGFPRMARRKPDAAGRNRAMAARIRYFAWEQNAGRALFCFPAGLLRRSPHASGVCFGRSFHLRRPGKRSPARAVPVQKSSAQSAHVSPMRRPKNVVPRQRPFPLGSKAQPMPPRPSPAQKGTVRFCARSLWDA